MAERYPERGLVVHKLARGRSAVLLRDLIRLAPTFDAAVLFGAAGFREGYVDLLAAGVIGRRGRPVVLTECYWETSSRSLARLVHADAPLGYDATPASAGRLARTVIRVVDSPRTHYCVLSSHEASAFPSLWGVDPARVHFTPFGYAPTADNRVDRGEATAVFAGGNSLRDYRALAAVAPTLDAPVVIATRLLQSSHDGNVRIGQLPQADYDRELRAARVVVVPLRDDTTRSAGQQTFLSAMALGKPVVVTDSPGVRDYVRDGETGLIVPPNDPQRLAEALRWLLDDANRADVEAMTAQARRDVAGNYSLAAYLDRVLDVVQTVLS
jgi:glycosyltransferase involved in cell wall biosynthesis